MELKMNEGMRYIRADKLDEETFNKLVNNALDITGAKVIDVHVDHSKNIVHINVNGVCILRVCQIIEPIAVRYTLPPRSRIK